MDLSARASAAHEHNPRGKNQASIHDRQHGLSAAFPHPHHEA